MTREVRSRIVAFPAAEVRRRGRQRHQRRVAAIAVSLVVSLGVLGNAAYAGLADDSARRIGPAGPVATSSPELFDLLPTPDVPRGVGPTGSFTPTEGVIAVGFLPLSALPDLSGTAAWRATFSGGGHPVRGHRPRREKSSLLQYVSLRRSGGHLILLTTEADLVAPATPSQATDPWMKAMPEAVRLAVR